MVYVPGPVPYAPQTLSQAPEMGLSIADMMLRNANAQAAFAANKWNTIGQGIQNVGSDIVQGMRQDRLNKQAELDNQIKSAQLHELQYSQDARNVLGQAFAQHSSQDGTTDFAGVRQFLVDKGRPDLITPALKQSLDTDEAIHKVQAAKFQDQQANNDYAATISKNLKERMATDPDGGIAALGHIVQTTDLKTPFGQMPVMQHAAQLFSQASQAYQQAQTPEQKQQVVQQFKGMLGPLADQGMTGASAELQSKWAKDLKDDTEKLAPGEKAISMSTGKVIGEGAPKIHQESIMTPQGPRRVNVDESGNVVGDIGAAMPTAASVNVMGGGPSGTSQEHVASVVDSLLDGSMTISQLSKRDKQYNDILAGVRKTSIERTGKPYNAEKAEADFTAAKRFASSLNGPQMVRFQGLGNSVVNTIDEVKSLAEDLKQGDIQKWNQAKRGTIQQLYGNTAQSESAAKYIAAVNTLKEEFASLVQGGLAPTEGAWKLANAQINQDYGLKDMNASLDEVQRLINFRLKGFQGMNPMLSGGGPATPSGPVLNIDGYTVRVK